MAAVRRRRRISPSMIFFMFVYLASSTGTLKHAYSMSTLNASWPTNGPCRPDWLKLPANACKLTKRSQSPKLSLVHNDSSSDHMSHTLMPPPLAAVAAAATTLRRWVARRRERAASSLSTSNSNERRSSMPSRRLVCTCRLLMPRCLSRSLRCMVASRRPSIRLKANTDWS